MVSDILITCILVFMNGFFVAAEFAIVKVRSSQLEMKIQAGNKAAVLAKHIVSHLDGYLAATQLGITLASLGLGWIGEPVVSKIIIDIFATAGLTLDPQVAHNIALPVAFTIITVLHIVFGELAPKSIAIQRSEVTTLYIAYPLQVFFVVFKPFIWVLNGIANTLLRIFGIPEVHGAELHSSEELKYLVQQGKESGAIEADNYDLIKNAFDFSERIAKQIIIPRTQISAIDANNFNEAALEKVLEDNYSRIPCYENNLDNIIGVVYLKDILNLMRKGKAINIRNIMRAIPVVPENKQLGQLLKEFQQKRQQIAVVVNEYGGTKGIITMEDILEELVGEIQDEYDNETTVVEKGVNHMYRILASRSLDDINKHLPRPIGKSERYETLAGLITFKKGKIPDTFDKIISDDYEFTVLKKTGASITLVQARDLAPPESA